jgi:hypothetical protein
MPFILPFRLAVTPLPVRNVRRTQPGIDRLSKPACIAKLFQRHRGRRD